MSRRLNFWLASIAVVILTVGIGTAHGQITPPRTFASGLQPTATLGEVLINQLKATTPERRAFIRYVVEQARLQRLEVRLILAVERYAIERHPPFPFPYFERAMRVEAGKRGVRLPPVRQFATTAAPTG